MVEKVWDFLNRVEFGVRNRLRWSRPLPENARVSDSDRKLQREYLEFLNLFSSEVFGETVKRSVGRRLRIVDVGTRNFSFAPAMEKFFDARGAEDIEIHGIEIDGYRMLKDFRSRFDYGNFFAQRIRNGHYHVMDFRNFSLLTDVVFLLNPFVLPQSVLKWGLPLKTLDPGALLSHARSILRDTGILILSTPTHREFEILVASAKKLGFTILEKQIWRPSPGSQQRRARYGACLRKSSNSLIP